MAIDTHTQPVPARFGSIKSGGDRTKAFRDAKRHSVVVRLLRWVFPVCLVCVSALYFLPSRFSVQVKGGEASVESIDVSEGGLKMVNPRIKGVNAKSGAYDIRADHATQHVKNPELITLNKINAELTSKSGGKTEITAPSGIYHSKKEELTFDNGVTIGGSSGFSGTLKTATAFFQANKLISTDPVELGFHDSTIKARSMTYYSEEARAIFEGGVRVHLERKQEGAPK